MSLDFYLVGKIRKSKCVCPHCENEHERESTEEYFSANITHNLNTMAGHAGIYDCLWRPDEHGIAKAHQVIEPLEKGIEVLLSDRALFEKFNPANGWGNYDALVNFARNVLSACKESPDADVRVSR